jgi:hypothetical protein
MAQNLQSGFQNRFNVMVIRSSGSSLQVVTDRPVDADGDGNKEEITLVQGTAVTNTENGNKMKPPTEPSDDPVHYEIEGISRSIIKRSTEPDGGKNITGQVHTITDVD